MKTKRNLNHVYQALSARVNGCFRRLRAFLHSSPERRNDGQGLVEFALVLPFLLLLILGIIEFSYVFAAYTSLFNAAREGARHGVVQPMDKTGIVYSAKGKIFLVNPNKATIKVGYDNGPNTSVFTDTAGISVGESRVLINITYDLPTITPLIHSLWPVLKVETQAARTISSSGNIESLLPPDGGFFGEGDGGSGDGDGGSGDGDGGDGGDGSAALVLSAEADPQTVYSGDPVLFTYTVTNTGDVDLTDVTIVDDLGNTITIGALAAGATAVETFTQDMTTTTINDVMATGYDPDGVAVDSNVDRVTVTVIGPALDLTVEVSPMEVLSGETATFIFTVQNTGDVDLTDVKVTYSLAVSPTSPVDLAVGESVFWEVDLIVYETTTVYATATGVDPLGETVYSSEESATVTVVALAPIVISDPLYEGRTVVTGTAQAGQTVYIRDLMDQNFPADSATVLGDGSFEFAGLPPLVAGHVIVVEGYDKWDSASVQGVNLATIEISEPLCHADNIVHGTAEPNQVVTLALEGAVYQDSTTVDSSGNFTFTLYGGVTLQIGHLVEVSGYGESDTAEVVVCTRNAYIAISPQCGATGLTTITVEGYNWPAASGKLKQIGIYQDDYTNPNLVGIVDPATSSFVKEIQIDVTASSHTILARTEKSNGTPTGDVSAEATFISPCPAPNLVMTDLELLTPAPISTYQPLDFRVTVVNTGTMPINNLFWVDIYSSAPLSQTTGVAWGAISALDIDESATLTITLDSGFEATGEYKMWALADSWRQVDELDEEDNERGPITVTVSGEGSPPSPPDTGSGSIEGETWVSLAGFPVPHGRADVWCVNELGEEIASTTSDDNAQYLLSDLPAGAYTVMAETWIDGVWYSGSVTDIVVADGETAVAIIIMYK